MPEFGLPNCMVFLMRIILRAMKYPAVAKALLRKECNSAWKTPSATNFFFLFIYLGAFDFDAILRF
jgi:hypothetical protein